MERLFHMNRMVLKILRFFAILVFLLITPLSLHAEKQVTEYQVKAVFLFNLSYFVTWPAHVFGHDEYFTIGIFGEDPFGETLEKVVNGDKHEGKPIQIIRYKEQEKMGKCQCHILFIGADQVRNYPTIKQALQGYPVLTVADVPGFPEQGGMVNLVKNNRKIDVEINWKEAQNAGLTISSRLLSLARIIE